MKIIKYLFRVALAVRFMFHRATGTGSFGHDRAVRVSTCGTPKDNPLKRGLFRYHVKQFHESSCSVASVVCVVNTLLERIHQLPCPPVTQFQILEKVRAGHWKERMAPGGWHGKRGLPLEVLSRVTESALTAYGIPFVLVEAVRAHARNSDTIKQQLVSRLARFESKGDCLIIAHFDQGTFVQDLNIPHISPVGGYDPESGRVTLLDVDPFQSRPYQVSFNRFYKGISTHYYHLFRPYGYGRGGYVFIALQSTPNSDGLSRVR